MPNIFILCPFPIFVSYRIHHKKQQYRLVLFALDQEQDNHRPHNQLAIEQATFHLSVDRADNEFVDHNLMVL